MPDRKHPLHYLPLAITLLIAIVGAGFGPIAQLPHYHEFADQTHAFDVPHAADVLSNLGFLVVAIIGWVKLKPYRGLLLRGWPSYRLFLVALGLTAFGSAFYHWAPDNVGLVYDRLPIALACAALLAGVWTENAQGVDSHTPPALLALCAVVSVAWWHFTELAGSGDLRPYLFLQILPILLIPLWQVIYGAPRSERIGFAIAFGLYVVAKVCELQDHQILALTGWISGHTLKHLFATAAAAIIVGTLVQRTASARQAQQVRRVRQQQIEGAI